MKVFGSHTLNNQVLSANLEKLGEMDEELGLFGLKMVKEKEEKVNV